MLGSNTEKLLQIIDEIMVASDSLDISPVAYQIVIEGNSSMAGDHVYSEGGGSTSGHEHGPGSYKEKYNTQTISNVSKLLTAKGNLDAAMPKIELIKKSIYRKSTEMHNSIGSPYEELLRLQTALEKVVNYKRTCNVMGEYVQACCEANRLLNRTVQLIVDAKWAVITYGDYLERGYNHVQGQNPDTTK